MHAQLPALAAPGRSRLSAASTRAVIEGLVRVGDVLAIAGAGAGVAWWRFADTMPPSALTALALGCLLAPQLLAWLCDYGGSRLFRLGWRIPRLLVGWAATLGLVIAFLYALKSAEDVSRLWVGLWLLVGAVALVAVRVALRLLLGEEMIARALSRRLAVIGLGDQLVRTVDRLAPGGPELGGPPARRFYARVLHSFDRVTTLSGRMRTALAGLGRDANRIGLFPNWVDADKYRPVDASALRAELGIAPDEFVALYAGAMGEKQGVESLLDVARLLENERAVCLVLCGAGPARVRIETRAAAQPNVRLVDPQPEDRFLQLLSMADCHLLPQKRGVTHFVMPSKLGPMLASGKPIVAQAEEECEVARLIEGRHQVVPPEDASSLAGAVLSIAKAHGHFRAPEYTRAASAEPVLELPTA